MGDEAGEEVRWVQREPGVNKIQLKKRHCRKYCDDGKLYLVGETCPYVCKHESGNNEGCPMMDDQGDMLTVNRMQADSQGEMRKLKGKELRKRAQRACAACGSESSTA
jgi:hypothetical protein